GGQEAERPGERGVLTRWLTARRGERRPLDDGCDAIEARLNAGPEVSLAEAWPDDVVQDLPGLGVGEARFEAVADLDPHTALLFRDDEEHAVIDPLAAELPCLEDADRVVLDRVAVEAVHGEDCDLGAGPALEVRELRLQALAALGFEEPGQVVHSGREKRHLLRGPGAGSGQHQGDADEQEETERASSPRDGSRSRLAHRAALHSRSSRS